MSPQGEEIQQQLTDQFKCYCDTSITLAALAVIRRREASVKEACKNIAIFTAGMMEVEEDKLATELERLQQQGFVERHGDVYRITNPGKSLMFEMLKYWNTYVDSMNNLWGCYYGA